VPVEEALKAIAESSGRKGLKVELKGSSVIIDHPEYPLEIVVSQEAPGEFVVELRVKEGLEETIEEMLDDEIDPRAELEDALDQLLSVVDYAVRKLETMGYHVNKKTREAILDVYDAIESFLEEE